MDYVYFEKLLSENKDVFEKIQCEEQYKELKTKIIVDQERNSSIGKGAKKSVERLADCYIILERIIKKHKVEPILSVSKKLQGMIYEDLKIAAERRKNNKDILNRFCKDGYIKVPAFINGTEYFLYHNRISTIWSPVDYGKDLDFSDATTSYNVINAMNNLYLAYNYNKFCIKFIPLKNEKIKMDIFIRSKTTLKDENYCTIKILKEYTIKVKANTIMDCIDFTNCDYAKIVSKYNLYETLEDPNLKPYLLFEGKKKHFALSFGCELISMS